VDSPPAAPLDLVRSGVISGDDTVRVYRTDRDATGEDTLEHLAGIHGAAATTAAAATSMAESNTQILIGINQLKSDGRTTLNWAQATAIIAFFTLVAGVVVPYNQSKIDADKETRNAQHVEQARVYQERKVDALVELMRREHIDNLQVERMIIRALPRHTK
jgi:hypothetical protein